MSGSKESVIEKVRKALALAEDQGSENEAQNAMLLAQKLMAKHGLEMSDVEIAEEKSNKNKEVRENGTDYENSTWWAGQLAKVIGDNFRCFIYARKWGRKQAITFVGLKEDVELAKTVYNFAYKAVSHYSKDYTRKERKRREKEAGYEFKSMSLEDVMSMASLVGINVPRFSMKYDTDSVLKKQLVLEIKKLKGLTINAHGIRNDYIQGFLVGLKDKFDEQVKKEGWGLILVKDNDVVNYYENLDLKAGKARKISRSGDMRAKAAGYEKGKAFESPMGEIKG